jgi:SAM-dependent methyltransferase
LKHQPFTDQQLAEFQAAHDWKTARPLPDGRVLGGGKAGLPNDRRVDLVRQRLGEGLRVLEIGACEGQHSVLLAQFCREVVALEVRPRNVVGALIRQFLWGVRNVHNVVLDARSLDPALGEFDLIFHVGVLYHLSNPVEHLHAIAPFGKALLLDTHYATDDAQRKASSIAFGGRTWPTRVFHEAGWQDAFSGVEGTSQWLFKQDLLQLVRDIGFPQIEILRDEVERNGPRIGLLARR